MDKPYNTLSDREKLALKMLSISGWDIIQANSGGHKCITNISGLMYFGKAGNMFLKQLQSEFESELSLTVLNDLRNISEVGKPISENFIKNVDNKKVVDIISEVVTTTNKVTYELINNNDTNGYEITTYGDNNKPYSTIILNNDLNNVSVSFNKNKNYLQEQLDSNTFTKVKEDILKIIHTK